MGHDETYLFNERFQRAVTQVTVDPRSLDYWTELSNLVTDFNEAALMYGKVIIRERHLPGVCVCVLSFFFFFSSPFDELLEKII